MNPLDIAKIVCASQQAPASHQAKAKLEDMVKQQRLLRRWQAELWNAEGGIDGDGEWEIRSWDLDERTMVLRHRVPYVCEWMAFKRVSFWGLGLQGTCRIQSARVNARTGKFSWNNTDCAHSTHNGLLPLLPPYDAPSQTAQPVIVALPLRWYHEYKEQEDGWLSVRADFQRLLDELATDELYGARLIAPNHNVFWEAVDGWGRWVEQPVAGPHLEYEALTQHPQFASLLQAARDNEEAREAYQKAYQKWEDVALSTLTSGTLPISQGEAPQRPVPLPALASPLIPTLSDDEQREGWVLVGLRHIDQLHQLQHNKHGDYVVPSKVRIVWQGVRY